MFCTNCGNKLADDAKFCSNCGARVARPEEQSFRSMSDIDFEEPKYQSEAPAAEPAAFEEAKEPKEMPVREHISFDWSNVIDEPHKKETKVIKSPWEDTGGIDEEELYAEMTPSTDKSRTMSFIDVLRAEKEEKERAAADRAIEYTEVLEIGPDLGAFDEPPKLHYAPLYEDVDEPVVTPFDRPEQEKPEPVFEEEPRFETADLRKEPEAAPVAEPAKSEVELSRDTIAQFDEYVKSFEKEAGILKEEPKFEEPEREEDKFEKPLGGFFAPKFDLPDFLKRDDEKKAEQDAAAAESVEEKYLEDDSPDELFEEDEITFDDEPVEEPTFEVPAIEEAAEEEPAFEEPKYEGPTDGFDFVDDDVDTSMEDIYLNLEPGNEEPAFGRAAKAEAALLEDDLDDEEDDEEPEPIIEPEPEEQDEPVDEEALFKEMDESPKHTGMTIAEPADTEAEIEALKRRLAELMGTSVEDPEPPVIEPEPAAVEPEPEAEEPEPEIAEPEPEAAEPEPEEPEEEVDEIFFEPELTPEVDDLFAGLTAASQTPEEPVIEEAPAAEEIVLEEPAPVVEEIAPEVEEAPAAEEIVLEEPAPVVEEVVFEEPAPVVEEVAPVVEEAPAAEEIVFEEPAPEEIVFEEPAPEEIVFEEPAPVVEEVAPVVEEAHETEEPVQIVAEVPVAEEPAAEKETDALSLEELERDLFGDVADGDAEVEETKKIDKFYTLYKKNEEFQRLLDEEYEKLKHGGAPAPEEKAVEPEKPAETPVEDVKAYRQVEDETIYMAKEDVEKEIKQEADQEVKADVKPAAGIFEVKTDASAPVAIETTAAAAAVKAGDKKAAKGGDKKAEKAAAKAAKAAAKEEKRRAKAEKSGKSDYADVDSGNGVLTALAVIIAIILVILLAVILILQIAPESGIGLWIDSLVQSITNGLGAVNTDGGQFLL